MTYKNEYLDLTLVITMYFTNIVLYFITFSWIIMMEKTNCECSNNWKRTFIKTYVILMILGMILFSILYITHFMNFMTVITTKYSNVINILKYGMFISEIVYIIIVFLYIQDLIKGKCNCSNSLNREITLIYKIVDVIIMILSLIFIFMIGLYQIFR